MRENPGKVPAAPHPHPAAVPEAAMPGAGARGADGAQPARHAALTLRLLTALAPETAASGLYRFKASFAP